MPTLEGLAASNKVSAQATEGIDQGVRQQAAAQAAELFKAGDIKGALLSIAKVDPDHAANIISGFQQHLDTNSILDRSLAQSQGKTQGTFNVTTPNGSNPRQLLDAKLAGEAAKTAKKGDETTSTFTDKLSGLTGFKSKSGKILGYVGPDGHLHAPEELKGITPKTKTTATDTAVADTTTGEVPTTTPEKPKLLPNQDVNSDGQVVTIEPTQRKIIDQARKSFDTETKDIVKGLDASTQALELINKNIPGSGTLEKLRLLRGVVQGRINQQEFQAFGKGQGILNQIDNAISEAEGKGMSPKVQDLMRQMATVAVDLQMKEYDQHLQNAVERNPEVDPLILKKRLAGSGPTVIQSMTKKIAELPPQDQAAFNWAHSNPKDPKAQQILKHLGF